MSEREQFIEQYFNHYGISKNIEYFFALHRWLLLRTYKELANLSALELEQKFQSEFEK